MQRIFFDDYQELAVGEFPHDYSALGEYHFQEPLADTGKWIATTVHHSWRGTASWVVNTDNGRKVMEIAAIRNRRIPMIVTGDFGWSDYQIKTSFRPLSTNGSFGVLFRYESSRHYYALWFSEQRLQLITCNDDQETVIAEQKVDFNSDTYYSVEITVQDNLINAKVGNYFLKGKADLFSTGKVGFAGTHPARFGEIEVLMNPATYKGIELANQKNKEREQAKRGKMPQPVLWKKIATPGFGAGKSLRFGDLNNDGQKEILIAQNIRRIRGDNFSEISCLTAINLAGEILWQIGEPNPENALVSNDLPMQIHDIDGDGKLEVIFCKDFKIKVVDGETGQLKYEAPTPYAPPHQGDKMPETQYDRITGDSLYFCDISGTGADRDLIIKDRYNNIWAYTWDLKMIWHYQGNCGHFPMACDIDGDGFDELLIGYTLLDHDGSVLWSLDIGDHADGVAIGKFNQGDEWQFIIAASDEGMYWVNQQGEILQHHQIGHSQTATIAPFDPSNSDLQVATVTFWGNPGIIVFFDADGNFIKRKELIAPWGTALSPINWDGSGQELILLSGHPIHGGLMDFEYDRVVILPNDGHPYLCYEPVDLTGDNRDEILVWDAESIWIYTQDRKSNNSTYNPVRQPDYNMSNYRAQLSQIIDGSIKGE